MKLLNFLRTHRRSHSRRGCRATNGAGSRRRYRPVSRNDWLTSQSSSNCVSTPPTDRDRQLIIAQIAALRPHPDSSRALRAVEFARQRRTPHEILGLGVLDQAPSLVGTAAQTADTLEEWVPAGATDDFTVVIDDLHDGMDAFVDDGRTSPTSARSAPRRLSGGHAARPSRSSGTNRLGPP